MYKNSRHFDRHQKIFLSDLKASLLTLRMPCLETITEFTICKFCSETRLPGVWTNLKPDLLAEGMILLPVASEASTAIRETSTKRRLIFLSYKRNKTKRFFN